MLEQRCRVADGHDALTIPLVAAFVARYRELHDQPDSRSLGKVQSPSRTQPFNMTQHRHECVAVWANDPKRLVPRADMPFQAQTSNGALVEVD